MALLLKKTSLLGKTAPITIAATLILALASNVAQAAKCTDGRLQYANNLINADSTAVIQIKDSDNEDAKAAHAKAKKILKQAENEEDLALCKNYISQALTTMFSAVKMAKPEQASEVKHQVDFENKEKSVKALLDAMEYITAESKDKKKFKTLKADIDALTTKAHSLKDDGKVVDGTHVLEEAIVKLKNEVQAEREGVTLVRSLNFANKEEEYHYEIDRNDTHRMLVTVLLKEKREASDSVNAKVNSYMEKADALRVEADAAAEKKKFEDAIKLLEDSTKEIVRAIRSAGVYIPG